MKTNRLKVLNRQIEDIFNEPMAARINKMSIKQCKEGNKFQYAPCSICQEVRRENYRLKQEMFKEQEKRQQQISMKQELQALKELYALKCKEVQLLQDKLEQAQRCIQSSEIQKQSFKKESIKYFQNLLAK